MCVIDVSCSLSAPCSTLVCRALEASSDATAAPAPANCDHGTFRDGVRTEAAVGHDVILQGSPRNFDHDGTGVEGLIGVKEPLSSILISLFKKSAQ